MEDGYGLMDGWTGGVVKRPKQRPCMMLVRLTRPRTSRLTLFVLRRLASNSKDIGEESKEDRPPFSGVVEKSLNRVTLLGRAGADPRQGCQMAKFDPFLSLDCARVEGVGAQSNERKGSNFAIWQPW